ncbi:MAG: hypothetical protein V3T31_12995, partial [candidate division Zixibacteria bacterium]
MKSLAIIALILISPTTIVYGGWTTRADTVEVYYPDSTLQEHYQTVYYGGNESTGKTGFYRSYYENGKLEWDGQYGPGGKVDTWVRWDSTGYRAEEVTFVEGVKHGA